MTGLQLIRGSMLTGESADTWAGAALAEITHGPTGYQDLDMTPGRLSPGDLPAPGHPGARPALLTVLSGRLQVLPADAAPDTGPEAGVIAGPGDSVAVAPDCGYRLRAAGAGEVHYVLYRLAGTKGSS